MCAVAPILLPRCVCSRPNTVTQMCVQSSQHTQCLKIVCSHPSMHNTQMYVQSPQYSYADVCAVTFLQPMLPDTMQSPQYIQCLETAQPAQNYRPDDCAVIPVHVMLHDTVQPLQYAQCPDVCAVTPVHMRPRYSACSHPNTVSQIHVQLTRD